MLTVSRHAHRTSAIGPASSPQTRRPGVHLAGGSVGVLAAEALALPTALLLGAFITRHLGPAGFGVYTLAGTIVIWVEWTVASLFSRATVREASAGSAPGLGTRVLQASAVAGMAAAAAVIIAAPGLAAMLGEPAIVSPLRLLALDIPLFAVAVAHRSLLVGEGHYRPRAWTAAARWLGRLGAVVLLVSAGLGLTGVILGSLLASLCEIVAARRHVRPALFGTSTFPWGRLWADALPFLGLSITLRLFDRIDLLLFKTLGGTTADAGLYGAAQNLAQALAVISIAVPPLLLATLTRLRVEGDEGEARRVASVALSAALSLLALTGIVAAAGTPLTTWLFGDPFAGSGRLLAPLILVAALQVTGAVSIMVLTAFGRPHAFLPIGGVMLIAAVIGGVLLVPRHGALGAAAATAAAAVIGAVLGLRLTSRIAVPFPWRNMAAALAASLSGYLSTSGLLPVVPLFVALTGGVMAAAVTIAACARWEVAPR